MDSSYVFKHHPLPWHVHPVHAYRAKLTEVYGNELSCVALVDKNLNVVCYIPDDPPGIGPVIAERLALLCEVLNEP